MIEVADLYEKYDSYVKNVVAKYLLDTSYVDDVSQQVWLRVWRYIENFNGDSHIKTWLYTVAKNTTINQNVKLRKDVINRNFFNKDPDKLESDDFSPEQEILFQEYISEYSSFINNQNLKQRSVYRLYVAGEPYQVIADKLEIPIGTVRSRINRTKKMLPEKPLFVRNINKQKGAPPPSDDILDFGALPAYKCVGYTQSLEEVA